jgi:hypothetical protein
MQHACCGSQGHENLELEARHVLASDILQAQLLLQLPVYHTEQNNIQPTYCSMWHTHMGEFILLFLLAYAFTVPITFFTRISTTPTAAISCWGCPATNQHIKHAAAHHAPGSP